MFVRRSNVGPSAGSAPPKSLPSTHNAGGYPDRLRFQSALSTTREEKFKKLNVCWNAQQPGSGRTGLSVDSTLVAYRGELAMAHTAARVCAMPPPWQLSHWHIGCCTVAVPQRIWPMGSMSRSGKVPLERAWFPAAQHNHQSSIINHQSSIINDYSRQQEPIKSVKY